MPDLTRVLLVEDNPGDAELLSEMLCDLPDEFILTHRLTLHDAIQELAESPFDAVLLDLGLPDGGTGLEVLQSFRVANQDLPVIVLTGRSDASTTRAALREGAQDYLVKGQCDGPTIARSIRYSIDRMSATIKLRTTEEQLRQSQKLEAIGRLAGGVAHDINNLMTVVTGYCDLILTTIPEDQNIIKDMVDEVKAAGDRAARVTQQLLAYSRKQMLQPVVIELNTIVMGMETMLRRLIPEDIEVRFDLTPNVGKIKADSGQIEQVIMNLAINARDAMPNGGKLIIETANIQLNEQYWPIGFEGQPGSYVQLSVSDNGVGMDVMTQKHIFEPFFTTKAVGKGTGLGLATVYGIIKQSGGQIAVYSEPGHGTTFRIFLPIVGDAVTSPTYAARLKSTDLRGHETVLFAEDDVSIRLLARRILDKHGYSVLTARNGKEALKVSQEFAGKIDLLITDTIMPEMNGRQLCEALTKSRPATKVLYVSGYTENVIVHHGLLDPGVEFLHKPFTAESLLRRVRVLLNQNSQTGDISG